MDKEINFYIMKSITVGLTAQLKAHSTKSVTGYVCVTA